MRKRTTRIVVSVLTIAIICTIAISAEKKPEKPPEWKQGHKFTVHSYTEPRPDSIRPGKNPSDAPSDAIIIFDGTNTNELCNGKMEDTKWIINNEKALQCTKKAGTVRSKQAFGSIQLHVEFATPPIKGTGQSRGNSGVFLMGTYELQVLDSWQIKTGGHDTYDNATYADGQCGSIYGQKKPLVNASKSHGEWQTYDVIFHRPVFKGKTNEIIKPGTITVLHNGVLIQDNWPIKGVTHHKRTANYRYHPDKMPLTFQDHGNPIQYRNIWVREIPEQITE